MSSHIVAELNSADDFLHRRRAPPGGGDGVAQRLAPSIATQVAKAPSITTPEANAIALALAGSRFDEQEKIVITTALDERLATGCAMGQETTGKLCKLLEPPQQRLTNDDWEQLRSQNLSLQSKLDLVTMRMNRCGISNPDERTIRWLVALVAATHFEQLPSYRWCSTSFSPWNMPSLARRQLGHSATACSIQSRLQSCHQLSMHMLMTRATPLSQLSRNDCKSLPPSTSPCAKTASC